MPDLTCPHCSTSISSEKPASVRMAGMGIHFKLDEKELPLNQKDRDGNILICPECSGPCWIKDAGTRLEKMTLAQAELLPNEQKEALVDAIIESRNARSDDAWKVIEGTVEDGRKALEGKDTLRAIACGTLASAMALVNLAHGLSKVAKDVHASNTPPPEILAVVGAIKKKMEEMRSNGAAPKQEGN